MRRTVLLGLLVASVLLLAGAVPAFAGQASSGELLFYPCTSCHPVSEGQSTSGLPNGFKGHGIVLEGHDQLGTGGAACLACHDDPAKDPGKLKTASGALVDVKGDTTQVCFRCHSAKYREFKAGTHGRNQAKCTSAGCHDPHTPGWIYAGPLMPFTGTGFQFSVLPDKALFHPLAPPPPAPPVATPWWFVAAAVIGWLAAAGIAGKLILERPKS